MVQIAILGHGVVGSGVAEVLLDNADSIAQKAGQEIAVKYILDLRKFPELSYADKFTDDFNQIVDDCEVQVVVEVMGGLSPSFEYVCRCLQAGKSVVTSNKELVAAKGAYLLELAKQNNVNFLFEASVGGGIPIIRPLHQCLAANNIKEIAGILNGTTNFILTKMITENMSFDDALSMAQQLGYAERNPAADVEGHDTCRKICILSSLSFGEHVYPENVHTEGITQVTLEDVQYAEDANCVVKLIGQARPTEDGKVFAMVSPELVPKDNLLAGIQDVFNGILVKGDATGEVVFYGKGAGKLPTASAVIGDVIDCVKAEKTIQSLSWTDSTENNVVNYLEQSVRLYVRVSQATSQSIEELFGEVQYLNRKNQPKDELAFLTNQEVEQKLREKLDLLSQTGANLLGNIRLLEV